jgi:hypothetical protein
VLFVLSLVGERLGDLVLHPFAGDRRRQAARWANATGAARYEMPPLHRLVLRPHVDQAAVAPEDRIAMQSMDFATPIVAFYRTA